MVLIQRDITQHLPWKTQTSAFKGYLQWARRANIRIPARSVNFSLTPGAPFFSSPLFRRGPQKLSGGSHKDGWASAACSTFFTVDRRWSFPWQVSILLQARDRTNSSMAKGLFKSNDRYSPASSSFSSCACTQAPSDGSATGRLHKKRITSRRRDAPQSRF